jgi:CRP-like cAMP-binding protein
MKGNKALYDFLQQVFPMPQQLAEEIESLFRERSFQKGDFLLKEGKPCNDYYFLEQGFVRSFIYDWEGNDVTTNF